MTRAWVLPLACLALAGCDDGQPKSEAPKPQPRQISAQYDFLPPPAPPAPPPQAVVIPPPPPAPPPVEFKPPPLPQLVELPKVVFEDPEPLRRALMIQGILDKRRQQSGAILAAPAAPAADLSASLPDKMRLSDPDYSRDKVPEDRSGLPVDRFRVVTADRYIGAVLENAVNSQIPGRVVAVVERHVFGADGRLPLLPKGTRIICDYESLAKVGDTRLPVMCSRAIRPDGANVLLTNAQGADQMARTGFIGEVDNRIWERYGSAALIALVSATASLGGSATANQQVNQGGQALSQNLGQVTAKVLEQTVDLAPIIEVPAGSKIQIIPRTDIWLRQPERVTAGKTQEKG